MQLQLPVWMSLRKLKLMWVFLQLILHVQPVVGDFEFSVFFSSICYCDHLNFNSTAVLKTELQMKIVHQGAPDAPFRVSRAH